MPSLLHFDYFILTETWLTPDINDTELCMFDYNIYRLDRNPINSSTIKGGGVLIAVHRRFHSILLISTNINCEQISVMVNINNTKVLLHSCYIPPNSSVIVFKNHCVSLEILSLNYPDSLFLIAGDFNLPGTHCENSDLHANIKGLKNNKSEVLEELIMFLQLFQYNSTQNHYFNILDLVLSNSKDIAVSKTLFPLVKVDIAHPQLQIIVPRLNSSKNLIKLNHEFNFSKGNYSALNEYLCFINWNSIFHNQPNISSPVNIFYNIVSNSIKLFITKIHTRNNTFSKWYSTQLKNMII
jgi:hypothetical protein